MKTNKLLFIAVVTLTTMLHSFADETPDSLCTAFEIYVTKDKISYDFQVDYSTINLDTVELKEAPFLTSNQIESYDTVNHIINLKIPIDSLEFPQTPVYGQMFVVLANKEPVYCGFFWSAISSVPCHWIFMEDPNGPFGLNDFQIKISAGYPDHSFFTGSDPRDSVKVFDALQFCDVELTSAGYVPFPTENANWNVYLEYSISESPTVTTLLRYVLSGDTIINQKKYRRLCLERGSVNSPVIEPVGGLREENKKVYFIGKDFLGFNREEELLLYDFNKQIGDTVFHDNFYYSIIEDTDSVEIHGKFRKRFKIDSNSNYRFPDEEYWIEGIGSVKSGLLAHITLIPTCCYHYWEHVCFRENDVVKYLNPAFDDCFPSNSTSEPTLPDTTATWTIALSSWGSYYANETYRMKGDTTINSTTYRSVFCTKDSIYNPLISKYFCAVREFNNKWFFVPADSTKEFILYDFNLSTGDTVKIENPWIGEMKLHVIDVDSIELNGSYNKRIELGYYTSFPSDPPTISDHWIKGIGSTHGLHLSGLSYVDMDFQLLCFHRNNTLVYLNSPDGTCGFLSTSNETRPLFSDVRIYPNPVTHELQIENHTGKKLSLKIIDITGRTIVEQPLNELKSTINLSASPGVYAVLITNEKGEKMLERKVVKQ